MSEDGGAAQGRSGSGGLSSDRRGGLEEASRLALRHHRAGRLAEAERLCQDVLAVDPGDFVANRLLGLIAHGSGNHDAAVEFIRKALERDPDAAAAHNDLGNALADGGRPQDAEASYRRALDLHPDYAEANNNLGNLLTSGGRLEEAEQVYCRALALDPGYAAAHHNLANVRAASGRLKEAEGDYRRALDLRPDFAEALAGLGHVLRVRRRLDEAERCCRRALALKPDFAKAHKTLGNVLQDGGQSEAAEASYRRAVEIRPDFAEAHGALADVLGEGERWEEAVASHRRVVDLRPDLAAAHNSLGVGLEKAGRTEDAERAYRRAAELRPDFADAHNNLGNVLQEAEHLDDAVSAYRRALDVRPDFTEAHNNLANALKEAGRMAAAERHYRRALDLKPDFAEAHVNLAHLQLLAARFREGWAGWDWRWRVKGFPSTPRHFAAPLWDGSPVAGKRLLVWREQGTGDEIIHSTMIPDLLDAGAAVTIECGPRFQPLFRRSFPEAEVFAWTDPPHPALADGAFDWQVPAGSLARFLRRDRGAFPRKSPVLRADAARTAALRQRYRDRFPGRHLVGICWRSGGAVLAGGPRSVPVAAWGPILGDAGSAFISLQYGDLAEDIDDFRRLHGIDVHWDQEIDPLADLDAFAAQVAAMDLVLSICNTAAHMAGALAVPTWTLLRAVPYWPWLLEGDDCLWYPTMRLFRQSKRGDWTDVVERVATALAAR